MQEGQMPAPEGAPAGQEPPKQGGGGGIADALVGVDQGLAMIAKATAENPQVPPEAKQHFQTAREAYQAGVEILMQAAGGGAAPQGQPQGGAPQAAAPSPGGPVAPEAGGGRAIPMSPRGVR